MKTVFIIAGEPSGDLQAAKLLQHIKKQNSNISFYGIGGDKMAGQGLNLIKHMRDMAFMGFVEVIKHLPEIFANFRLVKNKLKEIKPDFIILVDYPGFNLKIAKIATKLSIPVVYYITPQLWAWHESRVTKMKKYVNLIINVFPFEVEFYKKYGIKSYYFGHPLTEELYASFETKEEFLGNLSVSSAPKLIGLLPGSRMSEIKKIMPILLNLVNRNRNLHFCLGKVTHIELSNYYSGKKPENLSVLESKSYDIMKYTDLVISASGTATLETACFQTPLIVVYKTSYITYSLAKILIKLPYISLVNIVSNKKIVPELIQNNFNVEQLEVEISEIYKNKESIKNKLKFISESLRHKDVSKNVASFILSEFRNEN